MNRKEEERESAKGNYISREQAGRFTGRDFSPMDYPFDAFEFKQYDQRDGNPTLEMKDQWTLAPEAIQAFSMSVKHITSPGETTQIDGGGPSDSGGTDRDGGEVPLAGADTVFNDNSSAIDVSGITSDAIVIESPVFFREGIVLASTSGGNVQDVYSHIDGKAKTFKQASAPSDSESNEGDFWYDTDDDNTLWVYVAGSWQKNYSLKSSNYSPGGPGWAIFSTGDVEFDSGTFRGSLDAAGGSFSGDLTVSSDNYNREISIGSAGILAKDSNDEIIHDIGEPQADSSFFYLGHLYWGYPGTSLYDSTTTTDINYYMEHGGTLTINAFSGTNIKGVLLRVHVRALSSTPSMTLFTRFRPSNTSWDLYRASNVPGTSIACYGYDNTSSYEVNQTTLVAVPVYNDTFDYYAFAANPGTNVLDSFEFEVNQLGVYI